MSCLRKKIVKGITYLAMLIAFVSLGVVDATPVGFAVIGGAWIWLGLVAWANS